MTPLQLQSRLAQLHNADDLRALFADLSYSAQFGDEVYFDADTKAAQRAQQNLASEPEIIAVSDEFRVIYARLADWNSAIGSQRALIHRLDFPFALWIFSDADGQNWHFVNVKRGGKAITRDGVSKTRHVLRRISLRSGRAPGRTVCERLARLDLQNISPSLFGLSGLQIQNAHDGAFDVEAVTKDFYNGYRRIVRDLQQSLRRQHDDPQWAHALALQTLNRLMFLRFIEKKEAQNEFWLGNDPEWSLSFWKAYRSTNSVTDSADEFYERWLCPLFFEAFNNEFDAAAHPHFPAATLETLENAPYLNGGLFKRNELDARHEHRIPDAFFAKIWDEFDGERPGFFERFNFTITEDSPFDQEVAVDPEMIGHVYESLINLSELVGESSDQAVGDERGDHGIFYTQRIEIDLMCRLALGDYLFNHLSKREDAPASLRATLRDDLLEWVFAYETGEKQRADERIGRLDLWEPLDGLLRRVTVCDPACGSGAFLVGMLAIATDLSKRTNAALGQNERDYDCCRRLIEQSLYGVDVMEWAAHVAELRLWLQLVIENDTNPRARKLLENPEPLLPNLSFKIRPGDSLVQELGGVTLGLGDQLQIPMELRSRLTELKKKKRLFFRAGEGFNVTQRDIETDEKNLFADVLVLKRRGLDHRLSEIDKARSTPDLFGKLPDARQQKSWDAQVAQLRAEREQIEVAGRELNALHRPPFVWRVSFFEVFDGKAADAGFDIVVGNPPYVRNEKIANPYEREESFKAAQRARFEAHETDEKKLAAQVEVAWKDSKTRYKAKLQRSVAEAWPQFFEGGKRRLDGKSDLYVYFFLHGLKLLAPGGAFCFITSNSWLDVGYGADLQEFLLKYGRVRAVFDNEVQRSFKSADVNTAVALLGRGTPSPKGNAPAMARFIMWRVPFEAASNAVVWQEIEAAGGRLLREEFRLRPFSHAELLQDGADPEKPDDYGGNKWGGKFLRAPEIYDVILEKGADKLERLGDVADVRFGIKTGANEFFYFDEAKAEEWNIEERFLRPVIKSPRDYYGISIESSNVKMFWCRSEKSELKGTNALEYIEWGEGQGFPNIASLRTRRNWFWLNGPEAPRLLWPSAFFERHIVYQCPEGYVADKVFYTISGDIPTSIAAFLNSTIVSLAVEVEGYQLNHGGIFVTTEWLRNLGVFADEDAELNAAFESITSRDIGLCSTELSRADRERLDWRVLQILGFTDKAALETLYKEVRSYVSKRIHKSGRSITQASREEK